MYQLLGPLSRPKEKVLTSRCKVWQLFSPWALFTGEKAPKMIGAFLLLSLKVLESPHQTTTSHQKISPRPVGQKKSSLFH